MLSSSRLVVVKNILVSLSTILIIALASNNLSSQELVVISTFILFFNLQNTLFEGLFGLHLLSVCTQAAGIAIIKQFKYMLLASLVSSVLFYIYMDSFGLYSSEELEFVSLTSFLIFIFGIISSSVTNVYCNQNDKAIFFIFDIAMLIFSVSFLYFHSTSLIYYLIPFGVRSLGTFFIYLKSLYDMRKGNSFYEGRLISERFFASTALSVSRDSLMPLACGLLLGPNVLVLMRIFNTIVSAPGLLANSMNKVVVRYLNQDGLDKKKVLNNYRLWLNIVSIGYLLFWFIGGQGVIEVFFSDKFDVNVDYLLISLCFFCFLWPLGQILIVRSLTNGDSYLYLKMSFIWTAAALINVLMLYLTSFEIYMVCFGIMQLINLIIYFKYYAYHKKDSK